MNSYASLRKQNKSRAWALAALVLCVILTASMLCSRLMVYAPAEERLYIPLTKANGVTRMVVGYRDAQGQFQMQDTAAGVPAANMLVAMPNMLTAKPGFQVSDENTVWQGETDIDIFRISYDNENGEVTVSSKGGDKVLAPGTGNSYAFSLENTGNVPVEYEMQMEAYFSNEEHPIPVVARVVSGDGRYLAGSDEAKADVLELNNVKDSAKLKPKYVMDYTLEWEWPFEGGDDAYDTLLGNMAENEDITLTIAIKTVATYTPSADDGNPKTGDTSNVALLAVLLVASLAGILVLLLLRRKRDTDEEA